MDYLNVPKSLIYKHRDNLKDFGVHISGTVNNYLFSQMVRMTLLRTGEAEKIALQCFNNAYYICTLIQMDEYPYLHLDKYEEVLMRVEIPFLGDVYQASMAMVCILLGAYDDRWKKKDDILIENIYHWTSSNKWYNNLCHKSFENIVNTCNAEGFTLPKSEFAPRDIIEAIDNVSINELVFGVEYVCERLALLADSRKKMFGADLTIAHLKDALRNVYKDYGYDPKTNSFEPAEYGTFGAEPDFEEYFRKESNPIKEAIEYIESHYPKEDACEQNILTDESQSEHKESAHATESQIADTAPFLKRIEDLEKLNAELEKDNKVLREQLVKSSSISSDEFEKLKSRAETLQSLYDAAENRLKRYESILGTEEELSKEKKFSIAERIIFCSALLGCSLSEDDIIQQQMAKMIMRFSGDKWEAIRTTISKMNGKRNALVEVANQAMKAKDAGARMVVWRKEEDKYKGITNAALNVYNYLHSSVKGGTVAAKIHNCKQAMENIDHAYYLSERKLITPPYNQPEGDEDKFVLPSAGI